MSLEEKVGQLFIAPACPLRGEDHWRDWEALLHTCHMGGVLVKKGDLSSHLALLQSEVKEESSYRRVCRFFTGFTFDMSRIVFLVFRLFPLGDKCILILDRTNWKWGKTPINILMLSIAYRGIGIPLFWVVLNLEGNSCAEDRIDLLKRVVERLGISRIEGFLADREFIGTQWFRFLIEQKIPFIIRIKQNSMVEVGESGKLPIGRLRKWLSRKTVVNHSINLWGLSLYVSIEKRKGAKEQMIVVSNFKFCWAYRTGDIQDQIQAIEVKTHGRKARSLFREGLNLIRRAIFGRWVLRKFRRLLSCFTVKVHSPRTKGARVSFIRGSELGKGRGTGTDI